MDLHPTTEHGEIISSAFDYLSREFPAERMPRETEPAISSSQWRGLADMGWFAMGLPETAGGLGLSVVEEVLVVREFGRHLVPPQAVATMIAAHAALAAGRASLAEQFASGLARAAFATPLGATGAHRLIDTGHAEWILTWTDQTVALSPIEAFFDQTVERSIDPTIEIRTSERFNAALAITPPADGGALADRARILCAAMLTGGAEALRDIAAEYAKVRHQFARPIGSLQAIAHPCADMAVRAEAALASLYYAAVCQRDGLSERALYAGATRSVAYRANYENATAAIQVHGGYGQTYDYLPHFYLKRAMIFELAGEPVAADEYRIFSSRAILA